MYSPWKVPVNKPFGKYLHTTLQLSNSPNGKCLLLSMESVCYSPVKPTPLVLLRQVAQEPPPHHAVPEEGAKESWRVGK